MDEFGKLGEADNLDLAFMHLFYNGLYTWDADDTDRRRPYEEICKIGFATNTQTVEKGVKYDNYSLLSAGLLFYSNLPEEFKDKAYSYYTYLENKKVEEKKEADDLSKKQTKAVTRSSKVSTTTAIITAIFSLIIVIITIVTCSREKGRDIREEARDKREIKKAFSDSINNSVNQEKLNKHDSVIEQILINIQPKKDTSKP